MRPFCEIDSFAFVYAKTSKPIRSFSCPWQTIPTSNQTQFSPDLDVCTRLSHHAFALSAIINETTLNLAELHLVCERHLSNSFQLNPSLLHRSHSSFAPGSRLIRYNKRTTIFHEATRGRSLLLRQHVLANPQSTSIWTSFV